MWPSVTLDIFKRGSSVVPTLPNETIKPQAVVVPLLTLLLSILWIIGKGSSNPTASTPLCISRAGGLSNEGFGSFFQHIKSSIILAEVLGAELHIRNMPYSEHGYSLQRFFRPNDCPSANSCNVDPFLLESILPSICAATLQRESVIDYLKLSGCMTLRHVVLREVHENFNDCVAPWYSRNVRPVLEAGTALAETRLASKCLRIGVHIRFGDLGTQNGRVEESTVFNFRSVQLHEINTALQQIEMGPGCVCRNISIYIKNGMGIAAHAIDSSNYTIVDSGDDFADLVHFMQNDVLVQGVSSFPVLAAFLSGTKKVVMTNLPDHPKYSQLYRLATNVQHFSQKLVFDCNKL